jgi:chaperonin GroEL (HSP60 family)
MTAKLITFNTEARRALEQVLDQVAKAVKISLGPRAAT